MQKKDIIFYGVVLGAIILCVILLFFMRSETAQCIKNPFIYGAEKMKDVQCSCFKVMPNGCNPPFFFNDTTFEARSIQCGGNKVYPEIDPETIKRMIGAE